MAFICSFSFMCSFSDGKLIYATSADLPISLAPSEPDEDIGYGKLFATVLFCAKGGISQLTSTAFNFLQYI